MMTALRPLLSVSVKPKSEAAKVWELSSVMVIVLSAPAGAVFTVASSMFNFDWIMILLNRLLLSASNILTSAKTITLPLPTASRAMTMLFVPSALVTRIASAD